MDTDRDPDPPKGCRSDRIRFHNTAAMFVQRFPMWQVWADHQQEVSEWIRIGIRIRQRDADPAVSGSTTLLQYLFIGFHVAGVGG